MTSSTADAHGAMTLGDPLVGLRLLAIATGCCLAAEGLLEVVLAVWAYRRGGPSLVAVFAAVLFLPAALTTPLIMVVAERTPRREVVIRTLTLACSALVATAALAMRVGDIALLVIVLGTAGVSLGTSVRPLEAALLPWLARTPEELIAAHRWTTIAQNAGSLAGPATGAICLAIGGPAVGVLAAALVLILAYALLLGVRPQAQHADTAARPGLISLLRVLLEGARVVSRPPALVGCVLLEALVIGALDVMLVVVALDLFHLGSGSVGWLRAMLGIGGVLGGSLAAGAVHGSRMARALTFAIALLAVPLVSLSLGKQSIVPFAAMFVIGVAHALVDVASNALLPRAFGARRVGRALAALQFGGLIGLSLGAVAASGLIRAIGIRPALGSLGALLLLAAGVFWGQMGRLDRGLPTPGPEVDLLRAVPMFRPLPLAVIEHLTSRVEAMTFDDAAIVMREGDTGDCYHLIVDGAAEASAQGLHLRTMGAGDGFGEIALLRDIPRTATVVASGILRTLRLDRDDFLAAITDHHDASAAATLLADQRLAIGLIGTTAPEVQA